MIAWFAIGTAALIVWVLRDEIRSAGREPLWVEHVCTDGEEIVIPIPPGISFDDVQRFLSEVERLPVCPEVEAR